MSNLVQDLGGLFTEMQDCWKRSILDGAKGKIVAGYAVTQPAPGNCSLGWFSGRTTLILGNGAKPQGAAPVLTQAEWPLAVPAKMMRKCEIAFLVIAAKRPLGGLHSHVCGAQAAVLINDHLKEDLKLEAKPPNHGDYFYRPPLPEDMPHLRPFNQCGTVCSWALEKSDLDPSLPEQKVSVRIGPEASWDVDYVALLLGAPHRCLRASVRRVAEWFASGAVGALATRLLA